jgi:hypothetical protein
MANNYIVYSTLFNWHLNTDDLINEVNTLLSNINEENEDEFAEYEVQADGVWFHPDESGNPSAVAAMITALLERFPASYPKGFQFTWAETCSKPRLDEFSGGGWAGILKDGEVLSEFFLPYIDAANWLIKRRPDE